MKQKRYSAEVRRTEILDTALKLAALSHYTHVTREQIADAVGVSPAAIQYHFKTMTQFRRQLVRAAIAFEHLPVIAQCCVANDSMVQRAPEELRRRAVEAFL